MLTPAISAAVEKLRGTVLADEVEVVVVLPVGGSAQVVARGTADRVTVRPPQVLRYVMMSGATAYVLVHIHPAGGPPSAADRAVTRRLVTASAFVGLRLLAHVVVTPTELYDCAADAIVRDLRAG